VRVKVQTVKQTHIVTIENDCCTNLHYALICKLDMGYAVILTGDVVPQIANESETEPLDVSLLTTVISVLFSSSDFQQLKYSKL